MRFTDSFLFVLTGLLTGASVAHAAQDVRVLDWSSNQESVQARLYTALLIDYQDRAQRARRPVGLGDPIATPEEAGYSRNGDTITLVEKEGRTYAKVECEYRINQQRAEYKCYFDLPYYLLGEFASNEWDEDEFYSSAQNFRMMLVNALWGLPTATNVPDDANGTSTVLIENGPSSVVCTFRGPSLGSRFSSLLTPGRASAYYGCHIEVPKNR